MNFIKFHLVVKGIQHLKVHVDFVLFEEPTELRPFISIMTQFDYDHSLLNSTGIEV